MHPTIQAGIIMSARILVAYASRKGSTAGIAHAIGNSKGYAVDISEMKSVTSLVGFSAVVIGAPVYTGKVTGDVIAFAAAHKDALSRLPVAGFDWYCTGESKDRRGKRVH